MSEWHVRTIVDDLKKKGDNERDAKRRRKRNRNQANEAPILNIKKYCVGRQSIRNIASYVDYLKSLHSKLAVEQGISLEMTLVV